MNKSERYITFEPRGDSFKINRFVEDFSEFGGIGKKVGEYSGKEFKGIAVKGYSSLYVFRLNKSNIVLELSPCKPELTIDGEEEIRRNLKIIKEKYPDINFVQTSI